MNKLQFKILNTVRLVLTRISSDVNLIAAFVVNNKRFAPHFRCDKVSEKGTNNQNRSSPVKNISKIIKSENSIAVKVDLTTKGKKKFQFLLLKKYHCVKYDRIKGANSNWFSGPVNLRCKCYIFLLPFFRTQRHFFLLIWHHRDICEREVQKLTILRRLISWVCVK